MDQAASWWEKLDDERLRCQVCPRACVLREGHRGFCHVRQNVGGRMVLTTWGRSTGFAIDPMEKKPLYHFHPGATVLSFGTPGCNLACKFCQNWTHSHASTTAEACATAPPEAIAAHAQQAGCRAVAFTYNDPIIWAEYAIATAQACRAVGVAPVAVTAAYVNPEVAAAFFAHMDAANVDLKAFSEAFYREHCGGALAPVLETLCHIRRHTACWLEITNLLIPGLNDSDAEVRALCQWIQTELGADTPLHFSAFHPAHKMRDRDRTPLATLTRARALAHAAGLRHVYLGNVREPQGQNTRCTQCGERLIQRDGYRIATYDLDAGRCPRCGAALAGRFPTVAAGAVPRADGTLEH